MDIKFSERYFFVSEDQESVIDQNYEISNDVPPQLPDTTATKVMNALTSGTSTAMTGIVTLNVILSLVMGLSLKKLWQLIQTLQIIVHLPLLQVPLPSNVISAFKAIIDVSNLNIIPKEYIKKILSVFMQDTGSSAKENFKQMDIFQKQFSHLYQTQLCNDMSQQVLCKIWGFCLFFQLLVQFQEQQFLFQHYYAENIHVFLGDYPFIQAFIQVKSSILLIIYVTYFKPYKKKSDYIFEIFNEFTLLTISYFLIVFIEIVSDYQLRYDIGWYVVVVTLFNIFTNWISMAFTIVLTIKEKLKEKCKKKQTLIANNNLSKVKIYEFNEADKVFSSQSN
eukprot:403340537